jgi:DNA-3-methyladenine glycosylase II
MGDLAAVNAIKMLKSLPQNTRPETLLNILEPWKPYQSVGTMLLWHYYLSLRAKPVKAVL